MQALAPITVTVGQDSTLDPSQTKQPIKAVILFNASPVVVKVSGGGQDFYLQPNSTQTMPASTPLGNIILAGVSSISSSSNSGSVYPTLIWTNDVMPGSPSASPVTDINVAGSLDATIQNASIAVQNYSGTTISTSSTQTSATESYTLQNGAYTYPGVAIPANAGDPVHGCVANAVFKITSVPSMGYVSLTITGNNTGQIVYGEYISQVGSAGTYTTLSVTMPISSDDTELLIATNNPVNMVGTFDVYLAFYTESIPPDNSVSGKLQINLTRLLPGNYGSFPALLSFPKGIAIADALAPADLWVQNAMNPGTGGWYEWEGITAPAIIRSIRMSNETTAAMEMGWAIGIASGVTSYVDIAMVGAGQTIQFITSTGVLFPSGDTNLWWYQGAGGNTRISAQWTSLT